MAIRATERRFCACGATREAPVQLRVVSCVRCGRALRATPEVAMPPPSTSVAILAALASQLLGAASFCVVLAWAWTTKTSDRVAIGALLAIAAAWVFAGGSALRGSITALGLCAGLDLVLALVAFVDGPLTRGFVRSAAELAPAVAGRAELIVEVAGGLAAVAAVACVAAFPYVRRFAAWQEAEIARVALG